MPWFTPSPRPDPNALRREAALSLIHTLEVHIPDAMQAAHQMLSSDGAPEMNISDLGRFLADMLHQLQKYIDNLQRRLQMDELRIQGLLKENDRLRGDPLRSQLADVQAQAEALTMRLAESETNLAAARQARAASQAEAEELRSYILRQNHIIAQLQLRLNHLLGETPSAETGGGPS